MGKYFNVKSRKNCKFCGKLIVVNRYRSYCSKKCRQKFYSKKYYKRIQRWQANRRAEYAPNKIRCLICGKWYYQVCSHVYHKHRITGREYRKLHGLDIKRGLLPVFLRHIKAEYVFSNKTVNNLKAGKKFWFKSGDKRVGKYERSQQTLKRLSLLHLLNKNHKKYVKTI